MKKPHLVGEDMSIEGLGRYIIEKDIRNILVLIGAGVSCAAGIPDFRSPKTGFYAQLEKYNLESPSDALSIALLRENPNIFYSIAKEMNIWPGNHSPTAVHHFIKLLEDQGRLLRVCTQNIDGLEGEACISDDLVVEAHGTFRHASCIDCHSPYDIQTNKKEAMEDVVSRCKECGGIVKPDVVFFGEALPEAFFSVVVEHDVKAADLVLIIGTSIQVQPFAQLPFLVRPNIIRVLINAERVGGSGFCFPTDVAPEVKEENVEKRPCANDSERTPPPESYSQTSRGYEKEEWSDGQVSSSSSDGFISFFDGQHSPSFFRDLFYPGDCQDTIKQLAAGMGCLEELNAMVGKSHSKKGGSI